MKICLTDTLATAFPALVFGMIMMVAGCGGSVSLLPSRYVVQLSVVSQYFGSITQQDSTGVDSTAQGNPQATRAVFFIDSANTQKVTITVDRYATCHSSKHRTRAISMTWHQVRFATFR